MERTWFSSRHLSSAGKLHTKCILPLKALTSGAIREASCSLMFSQPIISYNLLMKEKQQHEGIEYCFGNENNPLQVKALTV